MERKVCELKVPAFFSGPVAHQEPARVRLVPEAIETLLDFARVLACDVDGDRVVRRDAR